MPGCAHGVSKLKYKKAIKKTSKAREHVARLLSSPEEITEAHEPVLLKLYRYDRNRRNIKKTTGAGSSRIPVIVTDTPHAHGMVKTWEAKNENVFCETFSPKAESNQKIKIKGDRKGMQTPGFTKLSQGGGKMLTIKLRRLHAPPIKLLLFATEVFHNAAANSANRKDTELSPAFHAFAG